MKQQVLIIDDESWQADSFQRALQPEFSVMKAANAYEAIECIDTVVPDVIVLDVLLSGTTAWTLLHELQSHSDLAKIPIILVSNMATDIDSKVARPYGVKAIINKMTMKPGDITESIRGVLA